MGPWKTRDHSADEGVIYIESEHDGIASVFTYGDGATDQDWQKAKLIAAAPELYTALVFVRDHICDPERGPRDLYPAFGLNASEAMRLVQSAIAKVNGLAEGK